MKEQGKTKNIVTLDDLKKEIPDLIDNQPLTNMDLKNQLVTRYKYHSILDLIISHPEIDKVKICTGYFSPSIWEKVGSAFNTLTYKNDSPSFQLLIGSEIDERRTDEFQDWFDTRLKSELDHLPLDINLQNHIHMLIDFLKREDVEVALQTKPFVHAKVYWLSHLAFVGSSNFTVNGLARSTELNIPFYDKDQLDALENWFDKYFETSNKAYKVKLIEALENCKLGTREWSPYDVYMKIMYEYYKPTLSLSEESKSGLNLALFQKEGAHQLTKIMEKFGGAMLADSVGLGKSYQALQVIWNFQSKSINKRGLLICPAQLRENWKNILKQHNVWLDVISMESLALNVPEKEYHYVLIDESHNFRNPKTKRYNNLQKLLLRNKQAKVLLLTATPINTSLKDLYAQLMIVSKFSEVYEPFQDIGIANLQQFFTDVRNNAEDIGRLQHHLIVTRSRREIRMRQQYFGVDLDINGIPLSFPDRNLGTINYVITNEQLSGIESKELYETIVEHLDSLKFPYYNFEKYNLTEDVDKQKLAAGANISAMITVLLLKRLESSLLAFRSSVDSQMKMNALFKEITGENYFMKTPVIREVYEEASAEAEDSGEDPIDSFMDQIEKSFRKNSDIIDFNPDNYDIDELNDDLQADYESFKKMKSLVDDICSHEDKKLSALVNFLQSHSDQKILIFSYYKDTAEYIFEELSNRDDLTDEIELITGDTPHKKRNELIHRFAPLSNEDLKVDKDLSNLQILISTDVLSEGQNLQDASVCINYDLHWNPVRLIQRIGRIDRLKSPHDEIWAYNFFPEEGLDSLLTLIERLVKRLQLLNQVVELDGAVLTGEELDRKKNQYQRIQEGDVSILDELESEIELFDQNESRELILQEIMKKGSSYFQNIPLGIHSGFMSEQHSGLAVAIRVKKNKMETTLFGFEPDNPELYEDFLVNGIINRGQYVQKIMKCDEPEERLILENENLDGQMFERVIKISRKLKEIIYAKPVTKKLSRKIPRGNSTFLKGLKLARQFAYKLDYGLADISKVKNFLATTKYSLISNDFDGLFSDIRKTIKTTIDAKYSVISNKEEVLTYLDKLDDFIEQVSTYLTENKMLEKNSTEANNNETEFEFELIGFLRIYNQQYINSELEKRE